MTAVPPERNGLPADVEAIVRPLIGGSPAEVERFGRGGRPGQWRATAPDGSPVKVVAATDDAALQAEADRLTWLGGRGGAPRLWGCGTGGAVPAVLVTEWLDGVDLGAPEMRVDIERTVRELAAGLARLHAVAVEGCPFVEDRHLLAARCRARVDSGAVSAADLSPAYARVGTERLARAVTDAAAELVEPAEDRVFCHGRPTLAHAIARQGRMVGFTGWGAASVSDRYRDLAVAAADVATLSPVLVPLLFEAYGLERPDPQRLDFYVMVAQLS